MAINPQYSKPLFIVDPPRSDRNGRELLIVAIIPTMRNSPHNKLTLLQSLEIFNKFQFGEIVSIFNIQINSIARILGWLQIIPLFIPQGLINVTERKNNKV